MFGSRINQANFKNTSRVARFLSDGEGDNVAVITANESQFRVAIRDASERVPVEARRRPGGPQQL